MAKIFVNLPVKDLNKSIEFCKKLGFSINPKFTDDTAACVVISDDIYAMILTEFKFKQFTKKVIADSTKTNEVMTAFSAPSREKVDEFARKAVDAGGKILQDPIDYGWMYSQSVEDLDGHIWDIFWMDESKKPKQINQKIYAKNNLTSVVRERSQGGCRILHLRFQGLENQEHDNASQHTFGHSRCCYH